MTRLLIIALTAAFLSACGRSDTPLDTGLLADGSNLPVGVVSSLASQLFSDETELINAPPTMIKTRTLANTGIRIGYTSVGQLSSVDTAYIERQWQHMQRCTGQLAVAPFIVITEQAVAPLTHDDDIIFNIDGVPAASASAGLVPIIQVREADFDGSLGNVGFNLRSILGRYLWLSANLAERDYPFTCARTPG